MLKQEAAAVYVRPDELKPWSRNPRKGKPVAEVADSIRRFGFAAPIVARLDGTVIAGHTRLEAAQQLGLDRVPVRFVDLDEQEAAALALADNRLSELAEWDAFVAQVGSDRRLPSVPDTFPSVVQFPDRPEHPHQKPVALLVEHLTHWTPPWSAVLDPFAGSGTTLMAAASMGRAARLIELDPRCCDVIRRRWTRWARENNQDPGPGALDDEVADAGADR